MGAKYRIFLLQQQNEPRLEGTNFVYRLMDRKMKIQIQILFHAPCGLFREKQYILHFFFKKLLTKFIILKYVFSRTNLCTTLPSYI